MRDEARAKSWNTFRKNMYEYTDTHPEYSVKDFELQRLDASYKSWRDARDAERARDFKKARALYLKTVESFEQFEKLENIPALTAILNKLKTEYASFVLYRDPEYRALLKFILPIVQKFDGILQTEVYKWENSNFKKADFTYALYFAEKEGLIKREKKGRSYQVYFVRNKPDDTLQVIQDDEVDKQIAAQQQENMRGCGRLAANFILVCVCISLFPLIGPFALIPFAALVAFFVARAKREKKQNMGVKKISIEADIEP
ncbi:MAG: hypothetical protein LBT01_06080 [Spirochaetaceae bacterium]|jgi:hypothetical protein|nr:hypothetical protein [Spirochaetaceae bacterium]